MYKDDSSTVIETFPENVYISFLQTVQ